MWTIINNNLIIVFAGTAQLLLTTSDWEPAITDRYMEAASLEKLEPAMAPFVAEQAWSDAVSSSSIDLLHSYINLQTVYTDPDRFQKSAIWWNGLLKQYPREAASSVIKLDTEFIVWDLSSWPIDRDEYESAYRYVLLKVVFEAHDSLVKEIELQSEVVRNQVHPDLTPPEGMPFRTSPSSIQNPEKRLEYQTRLDEATNQQIQRVVLKELKNSHGEFLHLVPSNIHRLYNEATQDELISLIAMMRENGWEHSTLATAIATQWPELKTQLDSSN